MLWVFPWNGGRQNGLSATASNEGFANLHLWWKIKEHFQPKSGNPEHQRTGIVVSIMRGRIPPAIRHPHHCLREGK